MFNRFKTFAVAGLVAFGALAAVPATAQADSFYFGIGGGGRHGPDVEFRMGDRHDRRHWDRRDSRHGPSARGCSVRQALNKADRMGLRRAHLRNENRRAIVVGGRDRGRMVTIAFAKVPGCPVIR